MCLYTHVCHDTRDTRVRFGLHSRLWVQSGFLVLATPFAALTIYLEPPYCFIALGGWMSTSASKSSIRRFVITEKAPTRAFSWLKAATTAFMFHI